jgi:hypothetical protein
MTGRRTSVRAGLRSGRGLLPWIVVLLVSVSLAYAATSAVKGSWAPFPEPTASAVPASGEVRATTGIAADENTVPPSPIACAAYSGAYGWWLYDTADGKRCDPTVANEPTHSPGR